MSEAAKDDPGTDGPVLEVQGWFPDDDRLQAVIEGLRRAGYVRADASLPGDRDGASPGADERAPTPVDRQQVRTLNASMAGYVGAAIAGVAVLATGAAIPLAAGAALAAGLGAGGAVEGLGQEAAREGAEERDRRGAAGALVLAMHVRDAAHADEVTRIMRENGATETRSITRADEALTRGISAASWTG